MHRLATHINVDLTNYSNSPLLEELWNVTYPRRYALTSPQEYVVMEQTLITNIENINQCGIAIRWFKRHHNDSIVPVVKKNVRGRDYVKKTWTLYLTLRSRVPHQLELGRLGFEGTKTWSYDLELPLGIEQR